LANYYIPAQILLRRVFPSATVRPAPPITRRTLELGARHSPDFVCTPFKYTLGNYIEAAEKGADVLIQGGGGCRYGFYGELQKEILRDLGYDAQFINLSDLHGCAAGLWRLLKRLGSPLNLAALSRALLHAYKTVQIMDELDVILRENIGFERTPDSFLNLQREFFAKLPNVKHIGSLSVLGREYRQKYNAVAVDKPNKPFRVGLVGELYTLMEPFSNYFMEKELSKNRIVLSRYINLSYLLFAKTRQEQKTVADTGGYLKYQIGADGADSVAKTKALAEAGYDGVIHIKPFGCTPEINAMPVLMKLANDYKIPVLFFSFDAQTSETGIKTRLEAFYDMLNMRAAHNG
jgi:predicted nucleotide-binding protein (sugar kinase/HSP70/actin superfamily)